MVHTLSAARGASPSTNTSTNTAQAASGANIAAQHLAFRRVPWGEEDAAAVSAASSAGSRHGGRFHLLELAVERPVDLVVGSR